MISTNIEEPAGALNRPTDPRPPKRRGLRAHLGLLVMLSLTPLVGAGGWIVSRAVEAYRADFEERLLDTARGLALAVSSEVETHVAVAASLAASPAASRDDLSEFRAWAGEVSRGLRTWIVLSSLEPGLPQLVNTLLPQEVRPPMGGPSDAIDRMLQIGRPVVADLFGGHASRRPIASVVAPVPANEGTPRRAVGVILDPVRLARLLEAEGVRGGIAAVADGDGRVVARSRDHDRHVGAHAPSWYAITAEAQQGVFRGQSLEGTPALFGFHRLRAEPRWAVVVSTPLAAYNWSWQGPLIQLASAVIVALLVGLVAARWMASRLLKPVCGLLEQARAVVASAGSGAAPAAVPPSGVAEFEALRQAIEQSDGVLRRRVEAAMESEARFRGMADGAPVLIWMTDGEGRRVWFNRPWLLFRGRSTEEERACGWTAGLHPDDVENCRRRKAEHRMRQEPYSVEYRLRHHDGAWRWMLETAVPRHSVEGDFLGFIGSCVDITERHCAEERHLLLMREVDHRAKNALAVVQSIMRLAPPDEPRRFAATMEARVMALSRAHVLLAERGWESADLREVAEAGMSGAARARVVETSGPDILLAPSAVQPLALALHELVAACAAAAASAPGETLGSLRWSLDEEEDCLRLDWVGRGAAAGDPGNGVDRLGGRMVKALVVGQLGGRLHAGTTASGGTITVELPARRAVVGWTTGSRKPNPGDPCAPVDAADRIAMTPVTAS